MTQNSLVSLLVISIQNQRHYNIDKANQELINALMNYFDYFRFGMTMTMFFSALYPMNNHNQFINRKNNSLDPVHKAFYDMRVLLIQMCQFSIKDRPEPDTVFTKMGTIVKKMDDAIKNAQGQ
jgi:hypothetical protein